MKNQRDRIKNLTNTFQTFFEQEQQTCLNSLDSLAQSMRLLLGDTQDRRIKFMASHLKKLQDRFRLFNEMAHQNFFARIYSELEASQPLLAENRLASIFMSLLEAQQASQHGFYETLLDTLLQVTQAERGFVLLYFPETTEADVAAARNFQTRTLSIEEFAFSRTILRMVFQRNTSLLIHDASNDPAFSKELSVKKYQIKSVLVVPFKDNDRSLGAVYLENNTLPCAFSEDDVHLLEQTLCFVTAYLEHRHIFPASFEPDNRVFLEDRQASQDIIGQSPKMVSLLKTIGQIASTPATVLIEGESGTGKELIARALHFQSDRREGPFIALNCAAIPDHLLESELFGYEKGAFTGATQRFIGHIEQSNGGTIFLDEISELAYPLQAKLLRLLQLHEFYRLGGNQLVQVDVRVVAATSKNLKTLTQAGKFQEALYYRLQVIPLVVPPLRERRSDIPLLIDYFVEKFSTIYHRKLQVEAEVYTWFKTYPFPGNVRELENFIHRMVMLATGEKLGLADLPREILSVKPLHISLEKELLNRILNTPLTDLEDLHQRKKEIQHFFRKQELHLAQKVLQETGGNVTEAAQRMGVNRITLHKILRKARRTS